jgi:hypothetical protein
MRRWSTGGTARPGRGRSAVEGGDDAPEGEPVRQQATDTLDHRAGRDRALAYPAPAVERRHRSGNLIVEKVPRIGHGFRNFGGRLWPPICRRSS